MSDKAIIEITDLRKFFPIQRGVLRKTVGYVRAVDGISLEIRERESLGLVGESGCGKSTLGRTILRLYEPTSGNVTFYDDAGKYSLFDLRKTEMRKMRLQMQIIFQNPFSSLNERMTVMDNIIEPLVVNNIGTRAERRERAEVLLKHVGLKTEHLNMYPHSFSGGQRQRLGIARALAPNPRFIVADEAVSALDVSIQAHILELIRNLKSEFDLTLLFISHDLGVVRYISETIAVMYLGKIVEIAPRDDLLSFPKHPYTEALLSAVPKADPDHQVKRIVLRGEPPDITQLTIGCVFHGRCNYARDICKTMPQELELTKNNHYVACHLYESLELRGV